MQRKERFPPEADTQPDVLRAKSLAAARRSGMAPKKADDRHERPTDPPPPTRREKAPAPERSPRPEPGTEARSAVIRTGKPVKRKHSAAVDEVVAADMSRDPRRERDEDD
jgi:hypothetical protein